MTTPEAVMYAIVGCVGLLVRRNLTAGALAIVWLLGQVYYLATGVVLATSEYIVADLVVVAVIFAKATVREGCSAYPTLRDQMLHCWRALTPADKLILGLYAFAAWPVYASSLHPYYQWWALYNITIAQFILAGTEALLGYYRSFRRKPKPDNSNILQFAPAYSRRAQRVFGAEPITSTSSDTLLLCVEKAGDG